MCYICSIASVDFVSADLSRPFLRRLGRLLNFGEHFLFLSSTFLPTSVRIEMLRVSVYIDGLSLYHSVDDWVKSEAQKNKRQVDHSLKWLDVKQLSEYLGRKISANAQKTKIVCINYFSAYGGLKKRNDKSQEEKTAADLRHRTYVRALEQCEVTCEMSYFTHNRRCYPLTSPDFWHKAEEKETDVKLTMKIMEDAFHDIFDAAILISIDGDFVPLLKKIREKYFKIAKVGILQNKISKTKDWRRKIKIYGEENIMLISRALIEQCQLPDIITLCDGRKIRRPDKYRHPSSS